MRRIRADGVICRGPTRRPEAISADRRSGFRNQFPTEHSVYSHRQMIALRSFSSRWLLAIVGPSFRRARCAVSWSLRCRLYAAFSGHRCRLGRRNHRGPPSPRTATGGSTARSTPRLDRVSVRVSASRPSVIRSPESDTLCRCGHGDAQVGGAASRGWRPRARTGRLLRPPAGHVDRGDLPRSRTSLASPDRLLPNMGRRQASRRGWVGWSSTGR